MGLIIEPFPPKGGTTNIEVPMYCPRCGNLPASDRMRFCPSCGFRLDGVVDLIARDGVPTNPLPLPQSNEPSQRRKGIRRGAQITFASLVLFLPALAVSIAFEEAGPLVLPGTLFLTGIFWMLYYRLFGDETAHALRRAHPAQFGPPPQNAYLPPPQSVPVYRSHAETPQQQTVIEHTTRSLERQ